MSKNKKIVQVLYSGLGGHASVAFSLLEGFFQAGYNIAFVFYGIESLNKSYKKFLQQSPLVYEFYAIKKETKTGLKEWIRFYKYLKEIRPDIILLHSPQLILPAFIYKVINNAKIVTVEHDAISIRTKVKWFITNLNALLADQLIVLSEPYKKAVQKKLWFKKKIKKYHVVPNGIDIIKYPAKKEYFAGKEIKLFMASRMNELRDHKTLIKAVNHLIDKGYNISLRIAGDGNTLPVLKKEFGHNSHILFLGDLSDDKIINELQKADIYVHSTLAETFSTAILQAMSTALPVITTDIDGTRHMISNEQNGLFFKLFDEKDLINKIETLICNKEKAKKLGKNARRIVEEKYSIENVTQLYLKTFE